MSGSPALKSAMSSSPGVIDVLSYADALGVSPPYHQKEAQRWNSALKIYMQMASSDERTSTTSLIKLNDEDNHIHSAVVPVSKQRTFFKKLISVSDPNFVTLTSITQNKEMDDMPPTDPTTLTADTALNSNICDDVDSADNLASPPASAVDDLLHVPPVECEWRSICSYNSLYKPDVFPFMTALPSGRYGFMTPPVRSVCGPMMGRERIPRATSSMVSPCESSLNSLELEAIAAVHELQFVVKDIFVSELLPRTSELIFLNVTTLEGQAYCIELTVKGWRVTSLRHDCMNGDYNQIELHTRYFETIYSLMDNISPSYRHKFHEALSAKLLQLLQNSDNSTVGHRKPQPPQELFRPLDKENSFHRDSNVHFSIEGDEE